MNNLYKQVQDSLKEREALIEEAERLEKKAASLRNKAKVNNLDLEIKGIQEEMFLTFERIEILQNLVDLAAKSFPGNEDIIPISYDNYINCSVMGRSIKSLEEELIFLTTKLEYLKKLLSKICVYVGHDYKFIESTRVFSTESLEMINEDQAIYYCAICGEVIVREEKGEDIDISLKNRLKKLRKIRKSHIYQSRFRIIDDLDFNFDLDKANIKR